MRAGDELYLSNASQVDDELFLQAVTLGRGGGGAPYSWTQECVA